MRPARLARTRTRTRRRMRMPHVRRASAVLGCASSAVALLEEIVGRADGEKELMEALKEMGIKKMGHRQSIVGAVVGRL